MRKFLLTVFVISIITSTILVYKSYLNSEWEAVTASLSLIIAIISAWIAYEVFHKQNEAEKPQLLLSFDLFSRYGLLQLVLHNYGSTNAYNIDIDWTKPIIDTDGNRVVFSNREKHEILVLARNERIPIYIDGTTNYFEKFKSSDLHFSGVISFNLAITSKKRYRVPFELSLAPYENTLLNQNEDPKTNHELQKIPNELIKIQKEIKALRDTISLNKNKIQ